MNKQKVFDIVSDHLLTQMESSSVPHSELEGEDFCLYRNPNGLKCAIGCLIADEVYRPELEDKDVLEKDVLDAIQCSLSERVTKEDLYLLMDLQMIHDVYEPLEWRKELEACAKDYKLAFNYEMQLT
jgi:hypothetical protein